MTAPARRFRFPAGLRLRRPREFRSVYEGAVAARAGPLVVHGRPSSRAGTRLGLSVPRSAGIAVARNRIKRRLREAFRLTRDELPAGYDLVVTVRRHDALETVAYQGLLREAAAAIERRWAKRKSHPGG